MRTELFKIEHLKLMKTENQIAVDETFAERSPYSFSIFKEGSLLFCGGVTEYWPGRGNTWAMFNEGVKRDFPRLHRLVKILLAESPFRRLELSVVQGFENGHRWAKALGFKLEAENLEAYFPDGSAAALYSRVNLCR